MRLLPVYVHRIDNGTFLIDASDFPTTPTDNSRDRKFGPKKPAYRKYTEQIRHTFGAGDISNVIYGLDITTDRGVGSGDGAHYVSIMRQAISVADAVKASDSEDAFRARFTGDGAYGSRRNFRASLEAGVDLFTRERYREDRQKGKWPKNATETARMEKEQPEVYDGIMARRQKVEGTPSRIKRHNPYQKLRRRHSDPIPKYKDDRVKMLAQLVAEGKRQISALPEDVIEDILRVATEEVGIARLNEALMINIVASLKALVMMETFARRQIDFSTDTPLPPFKTIKLEDYVVMDDEAA